MREYTLSLLAVCISGRMYVTAIAISLLVAFAAPARAQLVGTDTAPGSSCAGFPAGATRVTADADLDGREVTLICDGSAWQAAFEPAADPDRGIQFNSSGRLTGSSNLVFTPAGNVGIGTADPQSALDVNGDITSRTITSCTQLGTDSAGKLICQGTAVPAMVFISTQTASNSASLQFTSLPTTHNTIFLNCAGLLLSADSEILVQVGEGAGPSWNTSANYTVASPYAATRQDGDAYALVSTTSNDLTGGALFSDSASSPLSLKMYLDNISLSGMTKIATYQIGGPRDYPSNGFYWIGGAGFWNNGANPVTAIRLITTGGTISSGTCSLYGMN